MGNEEEKQVPKQKLFPVVEIRHESALRCVHFPPNGTTIIVGGVDPTEGGSPATTIFSLRLYDFDINQALRKRSTRLHSSTDAQSVLTNVRTLVSRALLYNDGGFDVSPDGTKLCACAEYWLPNNVTCATDLFPKDDYYIPNDDSNEDDVHDEDLQNMDCNNSDKELQDDVNSDDIIHSNSSMQPSIDSSTTTTDTGSLHAVVPNASSDLSNTTTQSTTDTNNTNAATTTPF